MAKAQCTGLDNPFWKFSIDVYKNKSIKQLCLRFQDKEGVNVNLILLACWLSFAVEPLLESEFKTACRSVSNWQKKVTQPLRKIRQYLKTQSERSGLKTFYQLILDNEIQSESYQQDYLYHQFANKLEVTSYSNPEKLMQRYLFWLFEELKITMDDELIARAKNFIQLIQGALVDTSCPVALEITLSEQEPKS